ncbi:NADPH-dependent FMN reductase, partial [Legionella pneumophila serogroup 1]
MIIDKSINSFCINKFKEKFMFNVAVIVGSLRKESFNRKLAFALDKLQHP